MVLLEMIGDVVFEVVYWMQTRIRIYKIQKAFGFKFNRRQRNWLLHCKDSLREEINSWPRASGKTKCAIAWDLLYRKRPNPFEKSPQPEVVTLKNFFIPDPDIFSHGAVYYRDLYIEYMQAYFSCAAYGLALTPVEFNPGHALHPLLVGKKDGVRHE